MMVYTPDFDAPMAAPKRKRAAGSAPRPVDFAPVRVVWRDPLFWAGAALALGFAAIAVKAGAVALLRTPLKTIAQAPIAAPEAPTKPISTEIAPPRADLVDRAGILLASSVLTPTLFADPSIVVDPVQTAQAVARVIGDVDAGDLAVKLTNSGTRFVAIKRGVSPRETAAILDLGLPGIKLKKDRRRAYAHDHLAAQLIGFVGDDGEGLDGVEAAFDARLKAEPTLPLHLSIDLIVQSAVEEELQQAMSAFNASGGMALVISAKTGEILALSSLPSFQPSAFRTATANQLRNRAWVEPYELGSVMKPITIAMGLEAQAIAPDETFTLNQGLPRQNASPLRDSRLWDDPVSIEEMLTFSSNVGPAMIAQRLGTDGLAQGWRLLGLNAPAPIALSGSAAPILPSEPSAQTLAQIGYGYGISVTPLALARAYLAFAQDGTIPELTVLARTPGEETKRLRALSAETAARMRGYLRAVVETGTARAADIPGYEVLGKTGTAEKLDEEGGRDRDRNVASFVGLFPGWAPAYVVMVMLDEPVASDGAPRATGGATSAAAVGRIITRIGPVLGVQSPADSAKEQP